MTIGDILARPEIEPRTPLGKRLREVRAAIGIEDRDLFAERTGISKSTIANYERGDRTPDADMLERYRDVWSVDLNWLVTGHGSMFLTPDYAWPGPVQAFLDARKPRPSHKHPAKHSGASPLQDDEHSRDGPDLGRLAAAIEAVDEGLGGRSVPPAVKAELTIAAYELLTDATFENRARVMRLVKGA